MSIVINVPACIEPEDIAFAIIGNLSREEMVDFIMELDERIADYDFTSALIKRLQQALEAEGAAYNGTV